MLSHRVHVRAAAVAALVMIVVAFTPLASATQVTAQWDMTNCHGVATLALAPLSRVQSTLPAGYTALDAFTYQAIGQQSGRVPGQADTPNTHGLLGVELWKCDTITLGDVTVRDAVYASAAAIVEQPEGASSASLYFYKYENFFSDQRLVDESMRLGAPARLVTSADVSHTTDGATGHFTLANGGTYRLAAGHQYPLPPGNFEEWHEGKKGVSNWAAAFTVDHGGQGAGTVTVPATSLAARVMGGTSGSGAGIHTGSSFDGGVTLTSA